MLFVNRTLSKQFKTRTSVKSLCFPFHSHPTVMYNFHAQSIGLLGSVSEKLWFTVRISWKGSVSPTSASHHMKVHAVSFHIHRAANTKFYQLSHRVDTHKQVYK